MNCIHKISGAKGKICKFLEGTDEFPDQYGIRWEKGTQKIGFHPYWNDRNLIKISYECNNNNNQIVFSTVLPDRSKGLHV